MYLSLKNRVQKVMFLLLIVGAAILLFHPVQGFCQLRAQRETISINIEGNNQEDVDWLRTWFKEYLSPRFDIVTQDGDKVLIVKVKRVGEYKWIGYSANIPEEIKRSAKTYKLTSKGEDNYEIRYEINMSLYDSKSTTRYDLTKLAAGEFNSIPGTVAYQIDKLDPVVSRIVSMERDRVIVDMGSNVGIRKGKRLEVFDAGNRKVGVIKVTGVQKEEFEAKIIKGEPKEGYIVKPQLPLAGGFGMKFTYFPTDVRPNPSYMNASGIVPKTVSDFGYSALLGLTLSASRIDLDLSTGYIKIDPLQGWQLVNLDLIGRFELMTDLLFLEFGGGGGVSLMLAQLKWARPEGTYDDKLNKNSGLTEKGSWVWNYEGFGGLAFHLSRFANLYVRGGYYGFSHPSKYQDSEAPKDAKEGYDINRDWLEYTFNKGKGIAFQGGVTIKFLR